MEEFSPPKSVFSLEPRIKEELFSETQQLQDIVSMLSTSQLLFISQQQVSVFLSVPPTFLSSRITMSRRFSTSVLWEFSMNTFIQNMHVIHVFDFYLAKYFPWIIRDILTHMQGEGGGSSDIWRDLPHTVTIAIDSRHSRQKKKTLVCPSY